MRIDKYLFSQKMTDSRTKAQTLIEKGAVMVNGSVVKSSSFDVTGDENIEIDYSELRYVSRGGLKLESALSQFDIDVNGAKAVDIGASTGGFTDCLIKHGARIVYAIDSGTSQLARVLREDDRVICLENTNARYIDDKVTHGKCDIAVCDLSFISQTLIYEALIKILKEGGLFISLIKPQFEVGKKYIGKGGIVKDQKARDEAVARVLNTAKELGLLNKGLFESPIKGGDGNTEYLALFEYVHILS